jgi:hypothetical protein
VAVPEPQRATTPDPSPPARHRRPPTAWVVHPFLLAAYPVLFLFAQNTSDQLSFDPLWMPLGAALLGAVVVFLVMVIVFADLDQAGLATAIVVVAFFTFGHVWNVVGEVIGSETALLVVWIGLIVGGVVLAWRLGRRARAVTAPLNLLAAIPLAFTLIGLGDFAITRGAAGGILEPVGGLLSAEGEERPDIYYLVFDRYLGSPALERHFGFDNEPFLRELEERGFFVARNSVANYPKTNLSLTSSLQMEYLDGEALNDAASSPADQGPINRAFQGRLTVPASLKELGYDFVLVPSWWPPTASNVDADLTLQYEGASEFTLALLETTMASALTGPREEVDPFAMSELRNYTLHQLEQMQRVPTLPGPKFVMAHFLIPHPPNLFDRDGSPFEGDAARLSADEKYVRQVEFTNARILDIVDAIRAAPGGDDAVIVLQADEGPFPPRYEANGETFRWEEATADELEIKFRILNAIRLPGTDAEAVGLDASMTPVNEFRIVFNALFDAGLELLPDRVYAHEDYRHFYDFVDVTDRIPGWSGTARDT